MKKIIILIFCMVFTVCLAMNEDESKGEIVEGLNDNAYFELVFKYVAPEYEITSKSQQILIHENLIDDQGEIINRDLVGKRFNNRIQEMPQVKYPNAGKGEIKQKKPLCLLQ